MFRIARLLNRNHKNNPIISIISFKIKAKNNLQYHSPKVAADQVNSRQDKTSILLLFLCILTLKVKITYLNKSIPTIS